MSLNYLVFCLFLFLPFPPFADSSEEPLVDLSDVLNTDADILGMLGKPSSDTGASCFSQALTRGQQFLRSGISSGGSLLLLSPCDCPIFQ